MSGFRGYAPPSEGKCRERKGCLIGKVGAYQQHFHDLKTPITAVKGYVEGIMDGVANTPEKMERYIKTIYNKANEMDRLINELTFYSKMDTNKIPYTFNKIYVTRILMTVPCGRFECEAAPRM